MCELFQSPPHALGMDELVLGWFRRSLRAALCNGDLARFSDRLRIAIENRESRFGL